MAYRPSTPQFINVYAAYLCTGSLYFGSHITKVGTLTATTLSVIDVGWSYVSWYPSYGGHVEYHGTYTPITAPIKDWRIMAYPTGTTRVLYKDPTQLIDIQDGVTELTGGYDIRFASHATTGVVNSNFWEHISEEWAQPAGQNSTHINMPYAVLLRHDRVYAMLATVTGASVPSDGTLATFTYGGSNISGSIFIPAEVYLLGSWSSGGAGSTGFYFKFDLGPTYSQVFGSYDTQGTGFGTLTTADVWNGTFYVEF